MARYTIENGLRKVPPYFTNFKVPVKARWIGKTLVDIQTSEFGEQENVIREAIANHQLFIETNVGRKKGTQTLIKGWPELSTRKLTISDAIHNCLHRHEPPVSSDPWKTVFEDDDLLVVSKPSGVPTHPTGAYYHNSLTEIIKHDTSLPQVYPLHRLDMATAGILMMAKSSHASKHYQALFSDKSRTTKHYYARVVGDFPEGTRLVNCPIFSVVTNGGYIRPNPTTVPANSSTIFTKVFYDSQSCQSVVRCHPVTGRPNQIRIHLRNMGFPIANDYVYYPKPHQRVNQIRIELENEIYRRLFVDYPQFGKFQPVDVLNTVLATGSVDVQQYTTGLEPQMEEMIRLRDQDFATLRSEYNTSCDECGRQLLTTDRDLSNNVIWLHAYKYHWYGNEPLSFEDDPPQWAQQS